MGLGSSAVSLRFAPLRYVALLFACHLAATVTSQLSAMDVSVRSTMKGAAKCDKHCELQNSVNRQGFERILRFWDIPESMPASVSMLVVPVAADSLWASSAMLVPQDVLGTLEASIDRALCSSQLTKQLRVPVAVHCWQLLSCFASSSFKT